VLHRDTDVDRILPLVLGSFLWWDRQANRHAASFTGCNLTAERPKEGRANYHGKPSVLRTRECLAAGQTGPRTGLRPTSGHMDQDREGVW
jgi:hypothetical protein